MANTPHPDVIRAPLSRGSRIYPGRGVLVDFSREATSPSRSLVKRGTGSSPFFKGRLGGVRKFISQTSCFWLKPDHFRLSGRSINLTKGRLHQNGPDESRFPLID